MAHLGALPVASSYEPLLTQRLGEGGADEDGVCRAGADVVLDSPGECVAAVRDYLGAMSRDEDTLEHTNTYGLIDARSSELFIRGHVARATSLPWGSDGDELWERVHELPPRGIPIAVVSDKLDELNAVADFLAVNRIMPIVFRMLLTDDVVSALQQHDDEVEEDMRN